MIFEHRGKNVFNGQWVYGDLSRTNKNPDASSSYKINNNLVNFNTISLYLNYKDITGKKIYGYDIIKIKDKKYLIYYDIKQCSFCLLKLDDLYIKLFKNNLNCLTIVPDKEWWIKHNNDIKIIGNLFDNNDLLNGLTYNEIIKMVI